MQNCKSTLKNKNHCIFYGLNPWAVYPTVLGYIPLLPDQWSKVFQCSNNVQLGFNGDGSLGTLTYNGTKWASPTSPLAQFMYQTFDEADFDQFGRVYNYHGNVI